MDVKAFPALIVGVVVALVLAGAVLPVFAETTSATDTFKNEGRYYITTDIEDDITITMDYDIEGNVRSWYIDDVLLEYNTIEDVPPATITTVAGADNLVVRTDGRYRGISSSTGNSDYSIAVTSSGIGLNASTVSNAPIMVASTEKTDNVMRYSADTDVYLLGDSEIVACGYTSIKMGESTENNVVISFKGNIDDGVTITAFYPDTTFEITNVSINVNKINAYKDLYKFTSVTFDVSYTDSEDVTYTTPCTYSVLAVPSEIIAEKAVHPDGPLTVMLNVLPLLAIAGLVTGAVVWFINRKG